MTRSRPRPPTRRTPRGRTDALAPSDAPWPPLLPAAGMNCPAANPSVVARRVLHHRAANTGYFAAAAPGPISIHPEPAA